MAGLIPGLDSAYPPSAASLASAKAAGVKLWAGYFSGQNILHGWSHADFQRVKDAGLLTIAFCSGWSNPDAMQAQGASWGVPICLDVEGGIRGDGSWVQAWLDKSLAGLYGNGPVHRGKGAVFHILAAYPGFDPQASWSTRYGAQPDGLCGWQWQGSHSAYGATVDSAWYDPGFANLRYGAASGVPTTPTGGELDLAIADDILTAVKGGYVVDPATGKDSTIATWSVLMQRFDKVDGEIAAIKATPPGSVDLTAITAALATLTTDIAAIKARVEKDLA